MQAASCVDGSVPLPYTRSMASVRPSAFSHYYGDAVRKLFLAAGVIMLVALPFFNQLLPVSVTTSLLAVLVISVVAGLTNPMQRWVMVLDVLLSLAAALVFEYHGIVGYTTSPLFLFLTNQALAIIFFFALYLSVKTLRSTIVADYTVRERKRAIREEQESGRYKTR